MFETFFSDFLSHLKNLKNYSDHTIRNYAIDLNQFKAFSEKKIEKEGLATFDFPLRMIDRKWVRDFLAWLKDEQQQEKRTVARRLSSLRSFFKYALKKKWIESDPAEEIERLKIDKTIPTILTYDQIHYLFQKPDVESYLGLRDRAIMELFYSSGLRLQELVNLNRNDIDFITLLMKIRGKGKKERLIPITKNAAYWIQKYLESPERGVETKEHAAEQDSQAVFLNKHGERITTRSVDRNFKNYLVQSGLAGKITPHTIRHTIATHWLENGMDIKLIQELLGHDQAATTTIYTSVSTKLKKKVYDTCHPRA